MNASGPTPSSTPAPAHSTAADPTRGILLMLAGCALLTLNDGLMKALVEKLPPMQVVALRGLFGFLMLLLLAPLLGGLHRLRPMNPRGAALLTVLMLFNLFLFPSSLRYIPLADAIMLAYLSPVFVALAAPWTLGERVGWQRAVAVFLGLAGSALVIAPDGDGWHPAVLLPLTVAVLVASRDLLTRRLIHGERALALVAMANLGAFLIGALSLPFGWTVIDVAQLGLLLATAALLTLSQFMMAASFRHAETAVLACLKYSSIFWAAALGWLVWGDALSAADWIGAGLITGSGVLITLRARPRRA